MFRIGYSKKYYTLWKVTESTEWVEVDGVNLPCKKRNAEFIKNLSFDEFTAKRKSIFEGVENYEVDLSLCGVKYLIEQYEAKSLDELFFEFCESRSEVVKEILLQNGFKDHNGQIIYPEHFQKIVTLKKFNLFDMKTKQEEIQELTAKIEELKKQRFEATKERLKECEFEIGEKVNVYSKIGFRYKDNAEKAFEGKGFVKGIDVDNEGEFVYTLKKEKKDGTESSFGFGWISLIIEKIK